MGAFVVKVYSLINTWCINGENHKPVHVKGQYLINALNVYSWAHKYQNLIMTPLFVFFNQKIINLFVLYMFIALFTGCSYCENHKPVHFKGQYLINALNVNSWAHKYQNLIMTPLFVFLIKK